MAFIPCPQVAQTHMIFTYGGQICENVFHTRRPANYTVDDLNAVAVIYRNWWDGNMKAISPTTLTLQRIESVSLESDEAPGIVLSAAPLPITGTNAGVQLPNNVSLAIKWVTAKRGRNWRGRTFHLGLQEGQVVESGVISASLTAIVAAYNALIGIFVTVPDKLCVVSRFNNNAPRPLGIFETITSVSADSTVDSQRRRLPGRGA